MGENVWGARVGYSELVGEVEGVALVGMGEGWCVGELVGSGRKLSHAEISNDSSELKHVTVKISQLLKINNFLE